MWGSAWGGGGGGEESPGGWEGSVPGVVVGGRYAHPPHLTDFFCPRLSMDLKAWRKYGEGVFSP